VVVRAEATSYYDRASCIAWVNTNGCIYDPNYPDPEYCAARAACVAQTASFSYIFEIDAVARASALLLLPTRHLLVFESTALLCTCIASVLL
jgi:hypothetical protein